MKPNHLVYKTVPHFPYPCKERKNSSFALQILPARLKIYVKYEQEGKKIKVFLHAHRGPILKLVSKEITKAGSFYNFQTKRQYICKELAGQRKLNFGSFY